MAAGHFMLPMQPCTWPRPKCSRWRKVGLDGIVELQLSQKQWLGRRLHEGSKGHFIRSHDHLLAESSLAVCCMSLEPPSHEAQCVDHHSLAPADMPFDFGVLTLRGRLYDHQASADGAASWCLHCAKPHRDGSLLRSTWMEDGLPGGQPALQLPGNLFQPWPTRRFEVGGPGRSESCGGQDSSCGTSGRSCSRVDWSSGRTTYAQERPGEAGRIVGSGGGSQGYRANDSSQSSSNGERSQGQEAAASTCGPYSREVYAAPNANKRQAPPTEPAPSMSWSSGESLTMGDVERRMREMLNQQNRQIQHLLTPVLQYMVAVQNQIPNGYPPCQAAPGPEMSVDHPGLTVEEAERINWEHGADLSRSNWKGDLAWKQWPS